MNLEEGYLTILGLEVVLGYGLVILLALWFEYLLLSQASVILTYSVFALTTFVAVIVYIEEFRRPKMDPVRVEPIAFDALDEEEFGFHVENVTGERISGGSRFAVMPRDLTMDGEPLDLYRFGEGSVLNHLLGSDNALDDALTGNCPMYCHSPAAQTDDWRGPWATYLPIEGGDRKKKISTHPFPIYKIMAQNFVQEVHQAGMSNELEERVESLVIEYNNQLPEDAKEFKVVYDPDKLIECVSNCLFPTLNIQGANEMSVVLRNLLKCHFKKEGGEWMVSKTEGHSI